MKKFNFKQMKTRQKLTANYNKMENIENIIPLVENDFYKAHKHILLPNVNKLMEYNGFCLCQICGAKFHKSIGYIMDNFDYSRILLDNWNIYCELNNIKTFIPTLYKLGKFGAFI